MGGRTFRYLALSQLVFFGFLSICIAIRPHFISERNQGGISNFGVMAETRIPYTLAFLFCASLLFVASGSLKRNQPTRGAFRRALVALGTLFLLVLASTYPYKVNVGFRDVHFALSILLVVVELGIAVGLLLPMQRTWIGCMLLLVQAAGCLLALVTLIGLTHLLLLAQALSNAAFGLLLLRGARKTSANSQP